VNLSRIVLDLIFEPGRFRLVPRAYREGEGDVRTCESSLVRIRGAVGGLFEGGPVQLACSIRNSPRGHEHLLPPDSML
jgi:hypothetical protein